MFHMKSFSPPPPDEAGKPRKQRAQMRRMVHYRNGVYEAQKARGSGQGHNRTALEGQQSGLEFLDQMNDSLDGSKFEDAPLDPLAKLGVLSFKNNQMPKTANGNVRPKIKTSIKHMRVLASPPAPTERDRSRSRIRAGAAATQASIEASSRTKRSQVTAAGTAHGSSTLHKRKMTEFSA